MVGHPTIELMLLGWIPLCLVAFATMRPQHAAILAVLGSMLLLPEKRGYDFPGLPSIGKIELGSLGLLLGALLFHSRTLTRGRTGWGLEVLACLSVVGILGTVLTNRDSMVIGTKFFPRSRTTTPRG